MTREEFSSLAASCQKTLRRFLTALCCGDAQLADDIAQETFIKAYLSIGKLTNIESFIPWLYRIAYNTFVNHKRSVQSYTGYDEATEQSSTEHADSAFKYQELYRALDMLSEKERTVVILFYMEGYAVKEIANITGSTDDAVRQQLSRARIHLRTLINQQA